MIEIKAKSDYCEMKFKTKSKGLNLIKRIYSNHKKIDNGTYFLLSINGANFTYSNKKPSTQLKLF